MKKRIALLAIAAAAGGGITASRGTRRAWATAHDPTDGAPLELPPGDEVTVTTADGAALAVHVAGPADGPLVVLAHGWTNDRRFWGPVARRLVAAGHRVAAYDQPGHGRSTVGTDGLSLDALADHLRAVLIHLDAHGAVVAGHSMGGMTAQAFAVRHPDVLAERVAGLVLVATACDGLERNARARSTLMKVVGSERLARSIANPRIGSHLVRGAVGARPVASHLAALAEAWVATPAASRSGCLPAMFDMDLAEGLRSLSLAVEIIVGSRDTLTPPARARRIAEVLPGARLTVVPDAGHQLHHEVPDLVADRIAALVPALQTV